MSIEGFVVAVKKQTGGEGETTNCPAQGGVYPTSSIIHLRTGFTGWPLAAQIWTVAHELGHLLDLEEQGTVGTNSECNDSDSIMHSPVTCGDVGPLTGPTDSDGLAIVKTPYDAGPRTTCG